MPNFDESIGSGIPDGVNTLIYTILKHFVSTLSNISSRVSDYLNNLRCPTMSDYKWYQDVFISRVMLRKDCHKPYWKEKFIDGSPPIFGMIIASLYDGLVYFNCYLDLTLALDDPNIVKTLTLNIASSGYHMEEGTKPFALIYHIYYILLGTQLNPSAINHKEPSSKTMLIQCSNLDAKVQVPKMIQWQDIRLPTE